MNIRLVKGVDALIGHVLARLVPSPDVPASQQLLQSILIIRPGGIGDAVHLIPSLQALRGAYPSANIDVLAEKRNSPVFTLCSHVDRVFHYDRPAEFFSLLRRNYDVIIDSEQWHSLSSVIARLIRSKYKIGFATNKRVRMFTHGIDYSHHDYEMESFPHLLQPLGFSSTLNNNTSFLSVPAVASKHLQNLIVGIGQPLVTLFPGASITERRWGADRFRGLAKRLLLAGMNVLVVGGGEDREVGDEIVNQGGLNLAGRTSLVETAAILQKSALLVSGDSGVLHMAVGLDVPTVSLFGPGIAKKWAPRGEKHIVLNINLPCSPCTKFGYTPKCPIGAKCIQDITVEEVFEAVMSLLQKTAD